MHSVVVVSRDQYRAVDLASGGRILATGVPDDRPSRAAEACDRRSDDPAAAGDRPGPGTVRTEFSDGRNHGRGGLSFVAAFRPRVRRPASTARHDCHRPQAQGPDAGDPGHGPPACAAGRATTLHLFRGPEGTPLAVYPQTPPFTRFTLSADGRLLVRQTAACRLEVREVGGSGPPLCTTRVGGFPRNPAVMLGDRWLLLRIRKSVQFIRWDHGRLECWARKGNVTAIVREVLAGSGLSPDGVEAGAAALPAFAAGAGSCAPPVARCSPWWTGSVRRRCSSRMAV